jgi:hypothetical protein
MPIMSFSHLLQTPQVKIEITHGTFKEQFIARATTFVTRRVVLSLMNKSEEMLVDCGCLCAPKLHISVVSSIPMLSKNTIGMSRKTTFFTIVEPKLWISFFFIDIAIIFT